MEDTKVSLSEIASEDALLAATVLQELCDRKLIDVAIETLERKLTILKRIRGDTSPPSLSPEGVVRNGFCELPESERKVLPKRKHRSTGEKHGGDRRSKEQIEASRCAYIAIANHIRTQGPDTVKHLAELYGLKYQTLYQAIKIHSKYRKWFELQGGKVYLTGEGRQQALVEKEGE